MSSGTPRCGWQSFISSPGLQRPAKFALVGAIGIIVQLAALQALTAVGCHYLWATGLAVEAAVLHNFMWHQRFTWADRGRSRVAETSARMLRFHISNGAISIAGSLLLTRWLVGEAGMGLLFANLLTIVACSVGNFLASDRWVFLSPAQAGTIIANRRAAEFADGLPSEAGCVVRKERK